MDGSAGGAAASANLPQMQHFKSFDHGAYVCAVLLSKNLRSLFTAAQSVVRLWDLEQPDEPATSVPVLSGDKYIRAMKFARSQELLAIAGETNEVVFWDLNHGKRKDACFLQATQTAYNLCVLNDFVCWVACSDGSVNLIDTRSGVVESRYEGHSDGVTCVEITHDGRVLSSSLDSTVRLWDTRQPSLPTTGFRFSSQVLTVSAEPNSSRMVVGLQNAKLEVLDYDNPRFKYELHMHESGVLGIKHSHDGKWFASVGKDGVLNGWRAPYGSSIFQAKEYTPDREPCTILCADISTDDNTIVTGASNYQASVYKRLPNNT